MFVCVRVILTTTAAAVLIDDLLTTLWSTLGNDKSRSGGRLAGLLEKTPSVEGRNKQLSGERAVSSAVTLMKAEITKTAEADGDNFFAFSLVGWYNNAHNFVFSAAHFACLMRAHKHTAHSITGLLFPTVCCTASVNCTHYSWEFYWLMSLLDD